MKIRHSQFSCLVLLASILLSGCAALLPKSTDVPGRPTVKDTVVLVRDDDGGVGRITVTTRGGTSELTAPNTFVEVSGSEKRPSGPKAIDQARIDLLFADSRKALPPAALSFILYFSLDSKELTAESKAHVAEILSSVKQREFYEISIIGHTDTTGSDEYNMGLSSARARTVSDALLSQGIRPDRIELRYHGKRDLLIPTGDNVSEPRNRRVEVVVK